MDVIISLTPKHLSLSLGHSSTVCFRRPLFFLISQHSPLEGKQALHSVAILPFAFIVFLRACAQFISGLTYVRLAPRLRNISPAPSTPETLPSYAAATAAAAGGPLPL